MSAALYGVPLYVRSKIQPFVGENSLLSRAFNIPRSFVNMLFVIPLKNSLALKAYGYTTWMWSKLWRIDDLNTRGSLRESEVEVGAEEQVALRDWPTGNLSSSIKRLYFYFLEHNFLGITKDSLELLRYDSKVLQGLHDFELPDALKSLFGVLPNEDVICKTDFNGGFPEDVKELFWSASLFVWRALLNRVVYNPVISWILPENKNMSEQKEASLEDSTQTNSNAEACHSTSSCITTASAASLLFCEASLLPKVISDSGSYAMTTTQDLLREAVLLFVPMALLENTTELLKNPSLSMTLSPMSVFWELFDYVSIWGLDVVDEMYNQPEINYAIIDDDDFHFVVNVPKMRRPILFIGIR